MPTAAEKIAQGLQLVLVLLVLGSCKAPEPPLRVATLPWPPYDLVHLADQLELLDRTRVELIEFQTPAEVVRAYRYDLVDVMLVTSHFALSTLSDRPDTRIFYAINVSLGGDALLSQPELEDAADLRGRRVGIEAAPLGTYTLIRALQHLEIDRSDITIVQVDTPDQADAFLSGALDAVVTYDPTRSRLLEYGANQLFSSDQIPFEIIDVMVARDALVAERPDDLAELVRAFNRGLELYRASPDQYSRELARRHDVSPEAYRRTLQAVELYDLRTNLQLFEASDGPFRRGLDQQCRIMADEGLLVSAPALDRLLDARILEFASSK